MTHTPPLETPLGHTLGTLLRRPWAWVVAAAAVAVLLLGRLTAGEVYWLVGGPEVAPFGEAPLDLPEGQSPTPLRIDLRKLAADESWDPTEEERLAALNSVLRRGDVVGLELGDLPVDEALLARLSALEGLEALGFEAGDSRHDADPDAVDLSPLRKLRALEVLDLRGRLNAATDLSPLRNLPRLRVLRVEPAGEGGDAQRAIIAGLGALETLYLDELRVLRTAESTRIDPPRPPALRTLYLEMSGGEDRGGRAAAVREAWPGVEVRNTLEASDDLPGLFSVFVAFALIQVMSLQLAAWWSVPQNETVPGFGRVHRVAGGLLLGAGVVLLAGAAVLSGAAVLPSAAAATLALCVAARSGLMVEGAAWCRSWRGGVLLLLASTAWLTLLVLLADDPLRLDLRGFFRGERPGWTTAVLVAAAAAAWSLRRRSRVVLRVRTANGLPPKLPGVGDAGPADPDPAETERRSARGWPHPGGHAAAAVCLPLAAAWAASSLWIQPALNAPERLRSGAAVAGFFVLMGTTAGAALGLFAVWRPRAEAFAGTVHLPPPRSASADRLHRDLHRGFLCFAPFVAAAGVWGSSLGSGVPGGLWMAALGAALLAGGAAVAATLLFRPAAAWICLGLLTAAGFVGGAWLAGRVEAGSVEPWLAVVPAAALAASGLLLRRARGRDRRREWGAIR